MKDYFLRITQRIVGSNLDFWRIRFKGVGTKKRNILIAITLVLCMRLFFYISFDNFARAERTVPLKDIAPETIDPLHKIKNETETKIVGASDNSGVCTNKEMEKKEIPLYLDKEKKHDENDYMELLNNYPMAEMIPYISEKDRKTASFLIAIAKKESDWGKHAPSRNGRDCFNYWGYKGSYNLTQGYSCFDSPEQAVAVVGERISELIDKRVDSPERMVVWKCGSSCAGHDPEGVRSWIGAVKMYFNKLNS
jgi:hypothetical protein